MRLRVMKANEVGSWMVISKSHRVYCISKFSMDITNIVERHSEQQL